MEPNLSLGVRQDQGVSGGWAPKGACGWCREAKRLKRKGDEGGRRWKWVQGSSQRVSAKVQRSRHSRLASLCTVTSEVSAGAVPVLVRWRPLVPDLYTISSLLNNNHSIQSRACCQYTSSWVPIVTLDSLTL